MKSVKVWTSLLLTSSLILHTFAATAAELPAGYTAVDHIIVPRGAYIDTGYKPNQNSCTMMDVTVQGKAEFWFSVSGADYTTDAYALCNDDWQGIYYAVDDDGGSFRLNHSKSNEDCIPTGRGDVPAG